jgi:hypothetical protein
MFIVCLLFSLCSISVYRSSKKCCTGTYTCRCQGKTRKAWPLKGYKYQLQDISLRVGTVGQVCYGTIALLFLFHWQSFRPHYIPGVDSATKRNEYQGYTLEGKAGRCLPLTLPYSHTDWLENVAVSNSGSPKSLSKPVMRLLLALLYSSTIQDIVRCSDCGMIKRWIICGWKWS